MPDLIYTTKLLGLSDFEKQISDYLKADYIGKSSFNIGWKLTPMQNEESFVYSNLGRLEFNLTVYPISKDEYKISLTNVKLVKTTKIL